MTFASKMKQLNSLKNRHLNLWLKIESLSNTDDLWIFKNHHFWKNLHFSIKDLIVNVWNNFFVFGVKMIYFSWTIRFFTMPRALSHVISQTLGECQIFFKFVLFIKIDDFDTKSEVKIFKRHNHNFFGIISPIFSLFSKIHFVLFFS